MAERKYNKQIIEQLFKIEEIEMKKKKCVPIPFYGN
jgi:hypothetical protein